MRIHVVLQVGEPQPILPPAAGTLLFGDIFLSRRSRWRGWLGSLLVHAAFFGLFSLISYHPWGEEDTAGLSAYRVVPLRLRIPDPIYFRGAPAPPRRPPRASTVPRQPSRRSGVAAAQHNPAPETRAAEGPAAVPRALQLPPLRARSAAGPVILQPNIDVRTKVLPSDLPSLAFWARQLPKIPKPTPKSLVLPGRASPPAVLPPLDAPPQLEIPNQETATADVNIAVALAHEHSALPVRPSSTAPIRLKERRPAPATPGATIDAFEGAPSNLIAITSNPPPSSRVVSVFPGVQNIPSPPVNGTIAGGGSPQNSTSSPGPHAPAGAPGRPEAKAPEAASAGPSAKSRAGALGTNTNPASQNAADAGARAIGSSVSDGGASAATMAAPPAERSPVPGAETGVTRIQHPASGIFDIVIVQPSDGGGLPETSGWLSGKPIYTVYLHVGPDRDWTMQYCLPAAPDPQANNSYAIQLDNPAPVSAPFPISTVVSNAFLAAHRAAYTLIHGFLTARGQFSRLAVVGGEQRLPASQIVPFLQQWEFRPATKDSRPVDVEILLAIPPRS